jgi:CHAD domain-containing protein
LLEPEPEELVLGAVAARIDDRARRDVRDGGRRITELRASERYARLLDDLEAFAAGAPFHEVTEEALRDRLRRDWRRLRRRAQTADGLPPGAAAAALHDTRKAAKRARYCAETLAPALGPRAETLAATAEQVQEALGSHRDSVLARRLLRELGVQAHLDGDNGFTFGRLHALEQVHGEAMLADYARVRPELDRGKLRHWLR